MTTSQLQFPQFHQVAMYADDHWAAVNMLKDLGHTEWSHDSALLVGELRDGTPILTCGLMSFNYTMLPGQELEILTYLGDSHHMREGRAVLRHPEHVTVPPFIAHMSAHVHNADAKAEKICDRLGVDWSYRFETYNHTNLHIMGKKRFREVMIETREKLGHDLKLIQRLTDGPWTIAERAEEERAGEDMWP